MSPVNTNLYSTITIFKHSILTHDKNFALDKNGSDLAIEEYLSTLDYETIQKFQYVKQGLSLVIKINKSQTQLSYAESNDWNYCKIINDNGTPCYYFIVKKEWMSKETIALSLVMDTLNTFKFNTDYIVNKKTTIQRQHKDRIKYLGDTPRLDERDGASQNVPEDESGYYTYPVGYVFEFSFTPSSGVKKYMMEYAEQVYDPYSPEPGSWGAFRPELEPFYNLETNTFGARVIAPFTVYSSDSRETYTIYMSIIPLDEHFCRDVDLISEGVNLPVYKKELGEIKDNTNDETWFLLYRNQNQPDPSEAFNNSPVDCFLIPEHSVKTLSPVTASLNTGNIDNGKYYLFDASYDGGKEQTAQFKVLNDTFTLSEKVTPSSFWEYATKTRYVLIVTSNGTSLSYQYVKMYKVYSPTATMKKIIINSGTLTSGTAISVIYAYSSILPKVYNYDPYSILDIDTYDAPSESDRISFTTQGSIRSGNITSLDRTDARNIKLIALPYCPAQTSLGNNDNLRIESNFVYDATTGWFKSTDVTSSFRNRFLSSQTRSPFSDMLLTELTLDVNEDRNDLLESKLYHSDFHRPKFVYDSFNYTYALERYDFSNYAEEHPELYDPDYYITFVMTRTINSKFLFLLDTDYLVNSVEDYDGVVAISRNNEEVLLNSAYINYVKTGFNYDKKTLARRQETNALGVGLSIGSAILGIIGSVATQNPLPAILGIGGAGIGLTGQIINNIQTQAQGEQTIQQKLEEASRQAVAIAGSDDIDLLTAYSNNKAKYVMYEISDRMKKLVGDLFYYCGYKLDVQGVPDKDSRYWFNFVQCELVVNYDSNVPVDVMNDLEERFKQGVTFFHYHNGFNLDQDKENLEISILNR